MGLNTVGDRRWACGLNIGLHRIFACGSKVASKPAAAARITPDRQHGYGLLELLIVMNIIAVLASLAYPAYINYKVRVNRADVQTEMHNIAVRLQQYQLIHQNFTHVNLNQLGHAKHYPRQEPVYFDLILEAKPHSWTLSARPKDNTLQENNGTLVLNHLGQSCWEQGQICRPTAQSNWNKRP